MDSGHGDILLLSDTSLIVGKFLSEPQPQAAIIKSLDSSGLFVLVSVYSWKLDKY